MKLTDMHEFSFEDECFLYMIQFPTSYLSKEVTSIIINSNIDMIVYFDEDEFCKIEYLYKLLMEEQRQKDLYNSKIIKNIIDTLLFMFFRKLNIDDTSVSKGNDSRINNIIIYIQNNFHRPLSISEMAKKFYMNNEYFSRYFKKHMRVGFREYLTNIRMDYAKKLVCESQLKVLDICMACGYNSVTTFLRDFKAKYNCTPKQMRQEI